MKIISSLWPPSWLVFLLPSSLPLPFLPLPCGFHLLPEKVKKFLNLPINKYFGCNADFKHRILSNYHLFPSKMAVSEQERFLNVILLKMRNSLNFNPISKKAII